MNSRTFKRGFTLIELMIVVAIIGILASIAIPSYQDYTIRAQVAEALVLAGELKPSINEFYKDHGSFPSDNESAGLPRTEHLIGQYVSGIEVSEGAMHIQFGNKAHAQIDGMTLTIRPVFVTENPTSPISWNCGQSSLPNGMSAAGADATDVLNQFLPSVCRS